VPAGAELLLVGHSQGGIAAMNLAGDPALNGPAGRYRITHVVAAGSPIGNKRPNGRTRVLGVEHQGDLIPELDGIEERATGWRTLYRFGRDRRVSLAVQHHSINAGYVPELAGSRFGTDPAVCAYLSSAAPYLLSQAGLPRRFRLDAGPYAEPDAVRLVRRLLRAPPGGGVGGHSLGTPGR
jgi:hypothetical protein